MNRLTFRIVALEQDARHLRRLSHEDALAALDAVPWSLTDFSDAELDAEWRQLVTEWDEAP